MNQNPGLYFLLAALRASLARPGPGVFLGRGWCRPVTARPGRRTCRKQDREAAAAQQEPRARGGHVVSEGMPVRLIQQQQQRCQPHEHIEG